MGVLVTLALAAFGGGWAEIAQPLAVLLGFAGVFTLGATRALRWD